MFEDGDWYAANCSDMSLDAEEGADSNPTPTPQSTRPSATATATTPPTSVSKPKIGTTVTIKGAKYTVNAVQDNIPGDRFSTVPAGKRWFAFDVTIEATAQGSYNPFDYSVQDDKAFVYEPGFVTVGAPTPRLSSGQLGPGGIVRGWVFFDVPADAKLTSVRVEPDFGSPPVVIADLTPWIEHGNAGVDCKKSIKGGQAWHFPKSNALE